ncbi:adaptin ear-binding coat-associated protein-like protein 1 [Phyllosticta citrichinensis]
METIDPTTGKPLPPDAIQRVLYIARQVHVYQIPPATSTKGYNASTWMGPNNERLIFTARLRVLETAIPKSAAAQSTATAGSATQSSAAGTSSADDREEDVKVDILLEDPATGQLFAGAPYTSPAVVEPTLDSSRFFAVRVVGEGRKATLGVGFEERSDAMDFNIALQDARKVLGLDQSGGGAGGRKAASAKTSAEKEQEKRDFSLKEGEMITVNIGRRGRRKADSPGEGSGEEQRDSQAALFSIKPPPAGGNGNGGGVPFLPPPPKTSDVKADRRRSRNMQLGAEAPRETLSKQPSAQELGFDDGEFGEFQ